MLEGYSLCEEKDEIHGTWHAHFYSKPPAQPTPHYIEDILGMKSSNEQIPNNVNKHIQKEIDQADVSSIRKSKQRAKYKSRVIKETITGNNRDTTRNKTKTPSKLTKAHNTTKVKQIEISKDENQVEVKKKKKARTTFTGRQIWELENTFKEKKYLTSAERNELAELLNVTDCQVKIWFQNRRTKYKKLEVNPINGENEIGEQLHGATNTPGSPLNSDCSTTDNKVSSEIKSSENITEQQTLFVKNENNNEENVCIEGDDKGN